jgi:hypothetical protein
MSPFIIAVQAAIIQILFSGRTTPTDVTVAPWRVPGDVELAGLSGMISDTIMFPLL